VSATDDQGESKMDDPITNEPTITGPDTAHAATKPATGSPAPGMSGRTRWLIAGGGIIAAVAVVAVAISVMASRPTPAALTYVPRDSDVVIELRPDLPGDQQQRVGNLLAHFPGFKDQSTLAQKLDESLARITSTISNGSVDYASQVKPWLAGPIFAAGDYPSLDTSTNPTFAIVFTTDGSVTCDPFTGTSTQTETYRGLAVHKPANESSAACVLDGKHAVVGTLDGVKAALDAHADHTAIDGLAAYQAARGKLAGDQLATVYVAYRQMSAGMFEGLSSALPSMGADVAALADALPEWAIVGLRAESNALLVDMVVAPFDANATSLLGLFNQPGASPIAMPSLLTAPPAHVSTLAAMVPANTAVLYELHGTGVTVQNVLASLQAMSGLGGPYSSFGQLDAVLGALGGVGGLVGWVGDAGVVVLSDGATADGGVILLAPDEATAVAKADQIRGWLTLAGQGLATTTDTSIDGTKVTLVDFGDASSLLAQLGAPSTGAAAIPPGTRIVLSVAAHGSAVILGSGESFARQVIETAGGSSLADQSSYKAAIGLASASNVGQLYVAVPPLLALAEKLIPASDSSRSYYESDLKPYLVPFDAIVETAATDGSGMRVRFVLTVK